MGKSSCYYFNRRLDVSENTSGYREEGNVLLLPGVEVQLLRRPARSIVTVVTELYGRLVRLDIAIKCMVLNAKIILTEGL
jgi:hypothetical protein